MTLESPSPPTKKKLAAGQIAGGVAGIAAGTYSGMNLLIPGIAALGIWLAGTKVSSPKDPKYLGAITAQGAQLTWLLVGMALLGAWGANLIDVVVIGGGLIWLWVRPGIWPVVFLTAFQLFALAINVSAILGQQIGTTEHRALVVHIGLRIIGIAAMCSAFRQGRRETSEA